MSQLFDAYGRPVSIDALTEPQAPATFAGIRNIYSTAHPSVGLTPERLSAILTQAEWGDPFLYLELAQDLEEKYPHYLSVLGTRKMAAAAQEITVTPASKGKQDQYNADFIRDVLIDNFDLGFASALVDVQDAVGKGFSVHEIMWETRKFSGKLAWLPKALRWRDPRWFMFDWVSGEQILVRTWKNEQGIPTETDFAEQRRKNMLLMEQTPDSSYIGIQPATAPLNPFKFVTHIAKAKSGLPIRGGLTRALSWVALFWNYTIKDWVVYAERFGIPARIGKYPTGASPDDQKRLLEACARIGSDATAIIPEVMKIELLVARQAGGARSQSVFQDLTRYIDDLCSKAALGQTLTVEAPTKGGSKAQGAVHEHVRRDILAWDVTRLSDSCTRDLGRPLIDLNVGPQEKYPRIKIGVPDSVDTKIFIDAVSQAVDRGVKVSQKAVREKIGVPEPNDDDELMQPQVTGRPDDDAYQESGGHKEKKPIPQLQARETSAAQHATKQVARAVVVNEMGLVLTVQRSDEPYVMIPGGHLEPGETFEMAAVREVYEETGIDVELLGHVCDFNDDHAERRYFKARHVSGEARSWDVDGGVSVDVRWVPFDEALSILTSEYDCVALAKVMKGERSAHQVVRQTATAVMRAADDAAFEAELRRMEGA